MIKLRFKFLAGQECNRVFAIKLYDVCFVHFVKQNKCSKSLKSNLLIEN